MTSARIRFAGPAWPSDPGKRVTLYPITDVPGRGRVQGVSAVSAAAFKPWAKPLQPTRASTWARAITFNCDRGNGRGVNPHVVAAHTHPNYSVERINGDHGCHRFRLRWTDVKVGQRRCAMIFVANSYGRSVNSNRICTEVLR